MAIRTTLVLASAITGVAGVVPARGTSPSAPPVFSQPVYTAFVDVSPPGLEGFLIEGFATDPDPGDIVTITVGGLDRFTRFETTPGNPATFRLIGSGLTYADRGFYVAFLGCDDNDPNNIGTGARYEITVVPEPLAPLGVTAVFVLCVRRRRANP